MKTLEKHNSEITLININNNAPCRNNISCPECGEELFDSNPSIILTSHPAQKNIHCESCGYTGYRLA
jgi:ribosomal protein S27AE